MHNYGALLGPSILVVSCARFLEAYSIHVYANTLYTPSDVLSGSTTTFICSREAQSISSEYNPHPLTAIPNALLSFMNLLPIYIYSSPSENSPNEPLSLPILCSPSDGHNVFPFHRLAQLRFLPSMGECGWSAPRQCWSFLHMHSSYTPLPLCLLLQLFHTPIPHIKTA